MAFRSGPAGNIGDMVMRSKFLASTLFILLMLFVSVVGVCQQFQRIDVLLRPILETPLPDLEETQAQLKARGVSCCVKDVSVRVGLIMRALDEASAEELARQVERLGGVVGSQFGPFVTARFPVERLADLSRVESLQYAEAARVLKPMLNISAPASGADLANWGTNLSRKYEGAGVVVGDVDTGIDWTHVDFRNEDGSTRLISLWDQQDDIGDPPSGFRYGTELTASEINSMLSGTPSIWATGLDAEYGHGTHVMSIAAGNGRAGAGMSGMAPSADIVFVKMSMSSEYGSEYMLDGINYIFQKAQSLGLPAVVNLSLGFSGGAHDGTSLACQAIDALTGPGKVIVTSAGNEAGDDEYGYYSHVGFEATGVEQTFAAWMLDEGSVELWYEPPGNIEVAVGAVDVYYGDILAHGPFIALGDSLSNQSIDDVFWGQVFTYDIDATETSNPNNGSRHCVIAVRPYSYYTAWFFAAAIAVRGDCYFDAWAGENTAMYFLGGLPGIHAGDSRLTITYPAYSPQIIAVGSYTARNEWSDVYGRRQYFPTARIGRISDFSSWGPSRRPEITGPKPEIVAPGQYVAAAFAAQNYAMGPDYYDVEAAIHDYYYIIAAGTSMSSPHVAGAVALLLQNNPSLTPDDVESILSQTAVVDSFTGAVHNDQYGYGKLDVHAALEQVDAGSIQPLGLDLQADYPLYQRGDTADVFAQAANIGPDRTVDFGMAVLDPAGTLWFWPQWTADYSVMRLSLSADFHLRDYLVTSFSVYPDFEPITTGGLYHVFGAFVDPDSGQFLGDICVSSFEVEL